jgi:hypothetical protein
MDTCTVGDALPVQLAPLQTPFVTLLKQQRATKPRDRGGVREDAGDVRAPFDPGVQPRTSGARRKPGGRAVFG